MPSSVAKGHAAGAETGQAKSAVRWRRAEARNEERSEAAGDSLMEK